MDQLLLKGIKVVELGNLMSAPYCTKLLADAGAEVIKIEKPNGGDESRQYGPFPNDSADPERSGLYLWLNSNKSGVTLNLNKPAGQELCRGLLKDADILVTNSPDHDLKNMGLDYPSLETSFERLVMVSITPFGTSGPYSKYKAYHLNSAAAGGVCVGIGDPDREPLAMPLSQGAYQAGVSGASAALVALLARRKTGQGQYIDISEVEAWAALHVGHHILTFLYRGVTGIRRGIHTGYFNYPNVCLPCKDGYVCLVTPQLEQWNRFVELMGNPEWTKMPRYKNRRAMQEEYPEEVDALIIPWLMERTKQEIFEVCLEKRIPCSPVYNIAELLEHPHLKARAFFTEIEHPRAGWLKYPGLPYAFSGQKKNIPRPAPLLGQHNENILCTQLGLTKDELTSLRKSEVI
jgi:crotonobetainyl-CoA:carnitine CoA-transferase CaiB-like acyl-CoA transferase